MNFAIFARILFSWIPSQGTSIVRSFLFSVTEPVLEPFRRLIPRVGMMDISPIIAVFALNIVQSVLLYFVSYIAY